jgi:hypothetical protein
VDFLFDHNARTSHHQFMSNIKPADLTPADREYHFFLDPERMTKIHLHVANGGSLIDIAKAAMIPYSKIMAWIRADKVRKDLYDHALTDRKEWAVERILNEVQTLTAFDLRRVLNSAGGFLPPDQWPDDIARAIVAMDVSEQFGPDGESAGLLKKIKTVSKEKMIELLMKNLAMLTEKHDVNHTVTLDQLIMQTQTKKDEIK